MRSVRDSAWNRREQEQRANKLHGNSNITSSQRDFFSLCVLALTWDWFWFVCK